jgi:hypothetical protein
MRRLARTLVLVILVLALVSIGSTAAFTQAADGAVRGAVTDDSGGVLPGVTVIVTSVDRRAIATAVTNAAGGYAFGALPSGTVRLAFQLNGFATTVVEVDVNPGTESIVVERLKVAPVTETVVVTADAPGDLPSIPFRSAAPPPPQVVPVPVHDRESICGPAKPKAFPEWLGTIRSARSDAERRLYTTGDELVIDGGTLDGLEVGRNLVARRLYRIRDGSAAGVTGEHTSGLLQVVTSDEHVSRAVVIYACDELVQGDFLAPFEPEPMREAEPAGGAPSYGDAARILFADAGQMLGVPRRLMVIDQGSDNSLRVGQRLTLFRPAAHGLATRSIVGDAVVVALRADSATIRVERATDTILFGDRAAIVGSR